MRCKSNDWFLYGMQHWAEMSETATKHMFKVNNKDIREACTIYPNDYFSKNAAQMFDRTLDTPH